jgi:adenine-specific DNA methylase
MVFTFHHWDANAWAELTTALKQARFQLVNNYVVFSEHPISVHIRNLNALKHDCILVLASENSSAGRAWEPVETVNTADSEQFCRDCGMMLGWLLSSSFSGEQIRAIWHERLLGD